MASTEKYLRVEIHEDDVSNRPESELYGSKYMYWEKGDDYRIAQVKLSADEYRTFIALLDNMRSRLEKGLGNCLERQAIDV